MLVGVLVAILLAPAEAEVPPVIDDSFEPVEIITPTTPITPVRADHPSDGVRIIGVVVDVNTSEPIVGAQLILDCDCLARPREQRTDERGRYRFVELPTGKYTVTAYAGLAELAKIVDVPKGSTFAGNFSIDPTIQRRITREIVYDLEQPPAELLSMDEAVELPFGQACERRCGARKRAERRRARKHRREDRRHARRSRGERSCRCEIGQGCPIR